MKPSASCVDFMMRSSVWQAGTIEQEAFLLVRARHANQPFGIGEMGGQVLHFFELDLSLGFLA